MSGDGTFETCWPMPPRAVHRGRPEAAEIVERMSEAEDPKFLAQLESIGVRRARLMMNTNGFPTGAAPGSLNSGDRIKP
jgi:hypothetical protein